MEKIYSIILSVITAFLVFVYLKKEINIKYLLVILFCAPFLIMLNLNFIKEIYYENLLTVTFVFTSFIIQITMFKIFNTTSNSEQLLTSKMMKIPFIRKWYKHLIIIFYLYIQVKIILSEIQIF